MRLAVIVLVWFGLMFATSAMAGSENEGKTGLSFLKVGVGARASGMGEAFTAAANDSYATFWNPAGLMAAKNSNLAFMHNIWLFDIKSEFGAIQFKRQRSSIAFHIYSFNVGEIEVRTIPSENPLETTSAHYLSMGLSYARSFSESLDIGMTLKYLYEKIFIHSAGGFGVDIGFRHKGIMKNVVLAGAIQNLGKMGEFRSESTTLPKIARFGAQYSLPQPLGPASLLFAGDIVKPLDENLRVHLGTEAGLWNQLMIRLGYMTGYESRSVSFGLGIRKSSFEIDYSYSPFLDDLGNGQRFSLHLAL